VEFPAATRISTATTFQIVRDRDGQRPRKTQTQIILTLVLLSVPDVTTGLIVAMLLVRIGNRVPELARAAILLLFAVPKWNQTRFADGLQFRRKHLGWPKPH